MTDDIAVDELKPLDRCLKTSIPHPCTHKYDETLSPFVPHQFANWVFNYGKQELMGKATLSQSQRGPGPFYNRTVLGKTNG